MSDSKSPYPDSLNPKPVDIREWLSALAGAILLGSLAVVCVMWGGPIGRGVVAAIGFGMGMVIAFSFSLADPRSEVQKKVWIILSVLFGTIATILGGWMGYLGDKLPGWVYPAAGCFMAVGGGWLGVRIYNYFRRSK